MKKLMWLLILAAPMTAHAEYVDVIAANLNAGCSVDKYLQIVKDFRAQWADERGYKVEILFPMQSRDLATFFWVGRTANAEAFGRGIEAWTAAQSDPNSTPAKLMARLRECSTSESRGGFRTM